MSATSTIFGMPALSKDAFNGLTGQLGMPFLITGKLLEPSQLTPEHLEFIDPSQKEKYIKDGKFTELFLQAYRQLVASKRQFTVAACLAESRTITVVKDLSQLPVEEKQMVKHLLKISKKIEELYMKQEGSFKFIPEVEKRKTIDPNSYKLFWRNHGPWATEPKFQKDPFANALITFEKHKVDIYPNDAEVNKDFIGLIEKDKQLANPWTVVRKDKEGNLVAIPFHEHYKVEMEEIAIEIEASAKAIKENQNEQPLYEYLVKAAAAFRTGDWDGADEKWVAMNMKNSKYAIRIAPDETYWDPANLKSGFEFWFALINEGAAEFSKKIDPYLQEMENHLHELVPKYPAKEVKFELPDFIETILLSGDHRKSTGAVIGQKLPNFNDKLSRMVVMTNYYTDEKTKGYSKEKASLIFVDKIAKAYEPSGLIGTTNTLLHEMTHSFGVRGSTFTIFNKDGSLKLDERNEPITSDKALGGQNSQVMEELKAQTGALYWTGWLKEKGVISEEMAMKLYTDAIFWCFGHISQGMKLGNGSPKTYSQLAGIQINHFIESGALTIEDGKFNIHYDKLPDSIRDLFKIVIEIQVYGDEMLATSLRHNISDGEGYTKIRAKEIQELYSVYPRPSFDLQVDLGE